MERKVPAVHLEETEGVPGPQEVLFLGKFRLGRGSRGRGSRCREPAPWTGILGRGAILPSGTACVEGAGVSGGSGVLTRGVRVQRVVRVSARGSQVQRGLQRISCWSSG